MDKLTADDVRDALRGGYAVDDGHGLTGQEVAILLAVLDRCAGPWGQLGECSAPASRLARFAGCRRAAAGRALASLVGKGWLVRLRSGAGAGGASVYACRLPQQGADNG